MLKNYIDMKEIGYFVCKIQQPFPRQVFPVSLLHVSAGNCQRALLDESGIIRNQMGM
jgi:hypothetical protein